MFMRSRVSLLAVAMAGAMPAGAAAQVGDPTEIVVEVSVQCELFSARRSSPSRG